MQTKSFYENHTFFQCDYDPNLFVSVNGRVLILEGGSVFKTYIGFKKDMAFNIIEEVYSIVNVPGVSSSPSIKA
eukprot:CAMPEP_0170527216 /NCGR_PEP_ID=MMETSP0209-20121228/12687_1 /TAXON_ID=665100 ORGANISM="Litonotus pictus, Strain P1" /NCGR_SAMPLE_ID=MMETSP0209 /ASSEMBLY_ACC=CAM_ASM_000301 /LENGTH=73 /DNA_ID=CAMNT_0010817597 /DNA_START=45 /DNA_END=262 /DNA_ORIENTATION=-